MISLRDAWRAQVETTETYHRAQQTAVDRMARFIRARRGNTKIVVCKVGDNRYWVLCAGDNTIKAWPKDYITFVASRDKLRIEMHSDGNSKSKLFPERRIDAAVEFVVGHMQQIIAAKKGARKR